MASFKNMHKFVRMVKVHRDESDRDDLFVGLTEDMEFLRSLKRQDAIDAFAKDNNMDKNQSSEVYQDSVKYKFIKPHNPNIPYQDKYLIVTVEGRHLLEKGGMWRAWADDNKNIATILISIIAGIVIGGISATVAIINLWKPS